MAITILSSPYTITPAYNPCMIEVTSNNQTQEGFQFIFDLYSGSTRLVGPRLPQNPYGYGETDMAEFAKNYVTYDFNPTATGITNAINSRAFFSVKIGEEYVQYVNFNIPSNFFGYQAYSSSTMSNSFTYGDEVTVSGNVASVNGTYTVLLGGANYLVFTTPYVPASSAVTFTTVVYANSRKTSFTGLSTVNFAVNNSVQSDINFISYNPNLYQQGTSTSKFLTDVPNLFEVNPNSRMWLNIYASTPAFTGSSSVIEVITYNNSGIQEGSYYISGTTAANDKMRKCGVGPWNLNVSPASINSGVLPIIKSTTGKYSVRLIEAGFGTWWSELKTFTVDQTYSKYQSFDLVFMDRGGSFIPRAFQLVNKQSIDIEREEYKKHKGYYNGTKWTYNTYDRGRTITNTTVKRKYTLNSNWITETDALYLEQLFTSPEVYWNDNGNFRAVIITTKGYEIKDRITSKLINLSIDMELASNDRVQSS